MNSNLLHVFQKKIHSFFKSKRINHELISDSALDTLKILKKNNFDAFIVGGAIRDILMDYKPKDFDIATNATPEQVRSIFKKSRIIGRRFKLVHVIYGREIIEVSTFRAKPRQKIQMSNGVLKDNEYGSIKEDAERRDFTINALYYDVEDKNLIDLPQVVLLYLIFLNNLNAKNLQMMIFYKFQKLYKCLGIKENPQ